MSRRRCQKCGVVRKKHLQRDSLVTRVLKLLLLFLKDFVCFYGRMTNLALLEPALGAYFGVTTLSLILSDYISLIGINPAAYGTFAHFPLIEEDKKSMRYLFKQVARMKKTEKDKTDSSHDEFSLTFRSQNKEVLLC